MSRINGCFVPALYPFQQTHAILQWIAVHSGTVHVRVSLVPIHSIISFAFHLRSLSSRHSWRFLSGTATCFVPAELYTWDLRLDPRIRNQLRFLLAWVLVADADLLALGFYTDSGRVALRGGYVDLGGTSRPEGGLTRVGLFWCVRRDPFICSFFLIRFELVRM